MKRIIYNVLNSLLALTVLFAVGCQENPEVDPGDTVVARPKVSSLEYLADKFTATSESFEVTYKDAKSIYYTCYEAGADKDWKSVDVDEKDGSVEITFADLDATAEYTAEVYAANGDEESAIKSAQFSSVHPAVTSVEIDEEQTTESSVVLNVEYEDADAVFYAFHKKGADSNKVWYEIAIDAEPATIIVDELEPETTYEAEVYVAYGKIKSEPVSKEFTTAERIPVPEITSAAVVAGSVMETSATISVEYNADATALHYVCYKTAEAESAEKTYLEFPILAAGSASVEIPVAELVGATDYTFEVYASNGEEVSESKTATFTTLTPLLDPEITSLAIVDDSITETSASFAVGYNIDVTALHYVYYKTAEAETAEKSYSTFPIWAAGSVSVEIPVSGLEAGTDYTFEIYASRDDLDSEPKTVAFTTLVPAPVPEVTSLAVAEDTLTKNSATITIGYNEDTKIVNFMYYKTAAAATVEKKYTAFPIMATGSTSVDMPVSGLESATEYTFEAYAANGDIEGELKSVTFTTEEAPAPTGPSITLSTSAIQFNSAKITVTYDSSYKTLQSTVVNYTCYKASEAETVTKTWSKGMNFYGYAYQDFTIYSLEQGTEYIFEAYATSPSGDDGAIATIEFSTKEQILLDPEEAISITNLKPTSSSVSFDLEIVSEKCQGVAYNLYPVANYDQSYFMSDISFGSATIVEADGTYTISNATIQPGADYILAYAPVGDIIHTESWGIAVTKATAYSEAPALIEFTTPVPAPGAIDQDITVEVSDSGIASLLISYTRESSETDGYYFGCVEASEVADGDVAAWLESQPSWFITSPKGTFVAYDYTVSGYVEKETMTQNYGSLNAGTDYYVFGVPVNSGELGNVCSILASTKAVVINNDIAYSIDVVPSTTSASFTFNFESSDCEKIYYVNAPAADYPGGKDNEELKALFLTYIASNQIYSVSDSDGDGVGTYEQSYLNMETDYVFYTVGVAADGSMTDIKECAYTTKGITFDSEATISCELSVSDYNPFMESVTAAFNMTMSNGAVSYKWKCLDYSLIPGGVDATPEECAKKAMASYPSTQSSATLASVYFANENYVLVVIPVDAQGDFGQPIIYQLDWSTINM